MKRSVGLIILQIAVALFLLVSGVTGIINSSAGELAPAVSFLDSLFNNSSIAIIMIIVLSVCEIVAGFFLITEIFTTDLRITDIILFIFIILWVLNIVLVDFIGPISEGSIFRSAGSVLQYLGALSSHLMVLGATMIVAKKFN